MQEYVRQTVLVLFAQLLRYPSLYASTVTLKTDIQNIKQQHLYTEKIMTHSNK